MKKELEDFIYGLAEFNSCVFCKRFGFDRDCPVKNFYENENPPSSKIKEGQELCKAYVLNSVNSLL